MHYSSPIAETSGTASAVSSVGLSLSSSSKDETSIHDVLKSPGDRNNLRIGSLNANSNKGKRAELAELLNYTQCDIVVISETKLPSEAEKKKSKHGHPNIFHQNTNQSFENR